MPAEGVRHGPQASDVSDERSSPPPNNQWTSVPYSPTYLLSLPL
jgi:hypothetical protein